MTQIQYGVEGAWSYLEKADGTIVLFHQEALAGEFDSLEAAIAHADLIDQEAPVFQSVEAILSSIREAAAARREARKVRQLVGA